MYGLIIIIVAIIVAGPCIPSSDYVIKPLLPTVDEARVRVPTVDEARVRGDRKP